VGQGEGQIVSQKLRRGSSKSRAGGPRKTQKKRQCRESREGIEKEWGNKGVEVMRGKINAARKVVGVSHDRREGIRKCNQQLGPLPQIHERLNELTSECLPPQRADETQE